MAKSAALKLLDRKNASGISSQLNEYKPT